MIRMLEKEAIGDRRERHPTQELYYWAIDDADIKQDFSASESRMLNPVSMQFCYFARQAKGELRLNDASLNSIGIYLMLNDYPIRAPYLQDKQAFNDGRLAFLCEYFSRIPPMPALGATASMMAAMLGRTLGATGPLFTFAPSLGALNVLTGQVRYDLQTKRIDSAVLGIAWSWASSFDQSIRWQGEPRDLVRLHFCKEPSEADISSIKSIYRQDLIRIKSALQGGTSE